MSLYLFDNGLLLFRRLGGDIFLFQLFNLVILRPAEPTLIATAIQHHGVKRCGNFWNLPVGEEDVPTAF